MISRTSTYAVVAGFRRIYSPLGFAKGYNFILWLIFGGAIMGFACSRFMHLDIDGILCGDGPHSILASQCYYYNRIMGRVGILMHLGGILPAGFLVVFQFVPAIRHSVPLLHRVNGYLILILSVIGTVGAFLLTRHALGGSVDVQTAMGLASVMFLVCLAIAYYNIKRLQIEQHRAWMIRAWAIAGFIMTMRIVTYIMVSIVASLGSNYHLSQPCYIIDSELHHNKTQVEALYPACRVFYSGSDPEAHAAVRAQAAADRPDQVSALLGSVFSAASWLSIVLHVLAAELYLDLTPAESERLRQISYQRQIQAGAASPGNAGLTVQRLGDAEPWLPALKLVSAERTSSLLSSRRDENKRKE